MVKVAVLIGAIVCTIGAILQTYFFSVFFSNASTAGITYLQSGLPSFHREDLTFEELAWYLGIFMNGFKMYIPIFSILLIYPGMILVSFLGTGSKKIGMIIGSIAIGLGYLALFAAWLFRLNFSNIGKIINIVYFITTIIYLIGLIGIRKQYKAGIVFGIFLVVLSVGSNLIFGVFLNYTAGSLSVEKLVNTSLILIVIQNFVFTIHAWVYSFSKKAGEEDGEAEEEMSIHKGSAFETFIEPQKKGKEKKKKSKDDSVEFTF